MKTWFSNTLKKFLGRRAIAPVLAIGMVGSLAAYQTTKPVVAKAASAVSSTAPLDDNSIGALLSLDHAMETLAARVTPAIVNVTVTSRAKASMAEGDVPEGMQDTPFGQFFGQQFGRQ